MSLAPPFTSTSWFALNVPCAELYDVTWSLTGIVVACVKSAFGVPGVA